MAAARETAAKNMESNGNLATRQTVWIASDMSVARGLRWLWNSMSIPKPHARILHITVARNYRINK